MDWIFSAFLAVSLAHMGEEYIYPGGFVDLMRRLDPRSAPQVTVRFAVIINGLQLLLCALAIAVGRDNLAFSLSVAGLLLINGALHIMGCIRVKGYAPGVITGGLLYLPLSVYAYYHFWGSGQLTLREGIASGLLGALYQAVPISYLALSTVVRRG
jgi:hypothetical protein